MTPNTSADASESDTGAAPAGSPLVGGPTSGTAEGAPSVTGILLVGGASRRFGSPKALARFRDETLAERAWRLLGEVCDERIAVGKSSDELDLPFPVLDDGAAERAPAYGLLAGLRAASHDVCVALPVDCPLVTPDALRSLAGARAVPQTGPLPGAYPKELLPELEARIAGGELTLRGLNPRVIELDDAVLANVNTPEDLNRISWIAVGKR